MSNMVRKRYCKKRKQDPALGTCSLPTSPRVSDGAIAALPGRELSGSLMYMKGTQAYSVSVSTLSSESNIIEDGIPVSPKKDFLNNKNTCFTAASVGMQKIERNSSISNCDIRKEKKKLKNKAKEIKNSPNEEESKITSSQESTPHLYTDYTQRLHNILLLNMSSDEFE